MMIRRDELIFGELAVGARITPQQAREIVQKNPYVKLVYTAIGGGAMTIGSATIHDAHASGVLGRNGRGTVDHFKVHGRVDIQVGTLSKAIGALGGYCTGFGSVSASGGVGGRSRG